MSADPTRSSPEPSGRAKRRRPPTGDPLALLDAGRRELEEAFVAGAPGPDLARRRASLMDDVLTALWEAADVPSGWSLVALGGYGRSELAPHSDIDVMILHAGRSSSRVASVAKRMFYPLWDAGFAVGNAVRTVRQTLDTAKDSLETQTTLLDGRLLAGAQAPWRDLTARLLEQVRRKGGRAFFESLRKELERRHDEFGKSAYLLEPNIKEGLGGLRDIQAIALVGKALLGLDGLAALAAAGELTEEDATAVRAAHDFLWTVRTYLHTRAERSDDRLTFDRQTELADALGYEGDKDSLAAERFMSGVFEHTGQVERVSAVFWERNAARLARSGRAVEPDRDLRDGLVLRAGQVDLADRVELEHRPGLVLELFSAAAAERRPVASEAIQAVQRALPSLPPADWDDATRRALLDLLTHGSHALPALELLTQMGVLSHFVPGWEQVRSLVQFDAYHIYTVDLHALHTVAELGKLRGGRYADREPIATELAAQVDDWDTLLLAGLLHDIGKPGGRGHAARGGHMVPDIARRMGLAEDVQKTLAFLVGSHLLLYNTATRRDLNDERVAIQAAQELRTPDRLRQLYLLTVADALATGPKAWTPWKSALVADLAVKTLHILERGDYASKSTRRRLTDTKRAVMAKLSAAYSARRIDAFLDSMPYAYLMAHEPDEIVRHFELMDGHSPDDVRTAVRSGPRQGLYELTVVTRDQSDLFATVAGSLSLNGVTIHSAEIYLRTNQQALMIFQVAGAFEDTLEDARWEKVKADVEGALDGRIALVWRLAERAARYRPRKAPRRAAEPRVVVDNEGSDFFTLVEVYAPDRVGLLFTITSTLHELRLRIHQARISTSGDEAADVFYVLDRRGEKVTDPEHINEIQRALGHALQAPA